MFKFKNNLINEKKRKHTDAFAIDALEAELPHHKSESKKFKRNEDEELVIAEVKVDRLSYLFDSSFKATTLSLKDRQT